MGDPAGPPLDRRTLLAALARHDVEFVMVGGQVGVVHEATRPTYDLDICVRWSPENLDRVGRMLVDVDAGLRVEGSSEPFVPPHRDGRFLQLLGISTWRTPNGDVDVLRGIPSPTHEVPYDELYGRAEWVTIDGHRVLVASLDDVILSKETLDRPSDRDALPELRAIRHRKVSQLGWPRNEPDPRPTFGLTPEPTSSDPTPLHIAVADQAGNVAGYVNEQLFRSGGPQPKNPEEAVEFSNTVKGTILEVFDTTGAIVGYFASRHGFVDTARKDTLVEEGFRLLVAPTPPVDPDAAPRP